LFKKVLRFMKIFPRAIITMCRYGILLSGNRDNAVKTYYLNIVYWLDFEEFEKNIVYIGRTPYYCYSFGINYNPLSEGLLALKAWLAGDVKLFLELVDDLIQRSNTY